MLFNSHEFELYIKSLLINAPVGHTLEHSPQAVQSSISSPDVVPISDLLSLFHIA